MATAVQRRSSRRRRLVLRWALVTVVVLGFYTAWRGVRAADAGADGKRALLAAEEQLSARDLDAADRSLAAAARAFGRAQDEVGGLGPIAWGLRITPFVRQQMRAVETFADGGAALTESAQRLSVAGRRLLEPEDDDLAFSAAVTVLEDIHRAVAEGRFVLDEAALRIAGLADVRLLGPLASARDDLIERLPDALARARGLDDGLNALVRFAGSAGARRYLVFSQNPDEPRPTGGFIGTYGVLDVRRGEMQLERFEGIGAWSRAHPDVAIPAAEAPTAFRIPAIPQPQHLGNVNVTPDWPAAAVLAMSMWERGGEEPVDGVLSITPDVMARIVDVLGPVSVPSFGETVTGDNLVERVDFHTHAEARAPESERKAFLAELAPLVVEQVLAAPASSWEELADAVGTGFDRREAMAWMGDDVINQALAQREWHGLLPQVEGDFFYNGEVAYQTKNGRGLRRVFDHHVELADDGSARITTDITITNTEPFDPSFNIDSLSYITIYGPQGATLDEASDPPTATEPEVAGHPAAGWDRAAAPDGGSVTFRVVWNAPSVASAQPDGSLEYRLSWLSVPAHRGDEVNLDVALPSGWRWLDDAPPRRVELDGQFRGAWRFAPVD